MKNFKEVWKELARNKKNTREHHVIYCILKAMNAKSNQNKVEIAVSLLHKAFTPTRNQNKLNNGWGRYKSIEEALYYMPHLNTGGLIACLENDEELKQFNEIKNKLRSSFQSGYSPVLKKVISESSLLENPYTYVFVRQDISKEQQVVQAAHVTLELGAHIGAEGAKNLHFVVCGVENEKELEKVLIYAINNDVEMVSFIEPDIGHQITAIASVPLKGRVREVFKEYKKLKYTD